MGVVDPMSSVLARAVPSPPPTERPELPATSLALLGVVVIGRNEGERLERCLDSVRSLANRVVYVDSGSSDGSIAAAAARSVIVVELDLALPFTAARARNEGFKRLMEAHPDLRYVFFVDGDCEIVPGWLEKASRFLDEHPEMAIVWGFRRERQPEASIYNLLCDMEWCDYPTGETKACGGDALIRVDAFRQVGGYRPELICGEEPEMCVRLRLLNWRIWHLVEPMTLHDAAMFHFSQWWKRMFRGGYGFAQGVALHGASPDRHAVIESRRAWTWGLFIPLIALCLMFIAGAWGLLFFAIYPIQIVRLALRGKRSPRENWWKAVALVVSKFAEMLGQMKYFVDRFRGIQPRLIEYK